VIVESEDLHRRAYNAAFEQFDIRCPGNDGIVDWSVEYYDDLQNTVGGGKPKMRHYFGATAVVNPSDGLCLWLMSVVCRARP
jgi:hypothetical protein